MAEDNTATAIANRVKERLGFMPGSKPQPTGNLIDAAVAEMRNKRQKEAEAEAEKLVMESVSLTETFLKAKSEAEAALKKAESEFTKKMGDLEKRILSAYARAANTNVAEPEADAEGDAAAEPAKTEAEDN